MTKFILLEILFLMQVSSLLCQTTITGKIQTNKNQPVPGANIYFKGTIEGTAICYCINETTIKTLEKYFSGILTQLKKKKSNCC